jgi:hypothetical protein
MGFFDRFKKTPTGPAPTEHVVEATPKFFDRVAAQGLRHGMWVVDDRNRVAVLTGLAPDGTAEISLAHKDGTANISVVVKAATLRQACYEEIPQSRRQELSPRRAMKMGYRCLNTY